LTTERSGVYSSDSIARSGHVYSKKNKIKE